MGKQDYWKMTATEFKRSKGFGGICTLINETGEPLVITVQKKETAVVISCDDFAFLQAAKEAAQYAEKKPNQPADDAGMRVGGSAFGGPSG